MYAQEVKQASGIAYHNDTLYIVGNDNTNNHRIFKYALNLNPSRLGKFSLKPAIDNVNFPQATDLEGIAFFNNHPVVLSENSSKIYATDRILVDYYNYKSPQAQEYENDIGLEGLAIKQINDSISMIATLWEGGSKRKRRHDPFILIHSLKDSLQEVFIASDSSVQEHLFYQDSLLKKLGLPAPVKGKGLALRAPELLWYGRSLIMLVGVDHPNHFGKKWLCKVDSTENRYEISECCKLGADDKLGDEVHLNWEGMTWVDDTHRKILLVADEGRELPMRVIEIPEG